MTASTSQVAISTSGDYKIIQSTEEIPLTLVHEVKVQVNGRSYTWLNCPVHIHNSEIACLEFTHILELLKSDSSTLSASIGIPEKQRSLLLQQIDDLFSTSLKDYKDSFRAALIKDMRVFDQKSYLIANMFAGFSWPGKCLGFFLAPLLTKAFIGTNSRLEWEGSRHRVMWLKEVDTREKILLDNIKDLIFNRVRVLHLNFEDEKKTGLICSKKFAELEQLNDLYHSLFPATKMILDEKIDIDAYVNQFK